MHNEDTPTADPNDEQRAIEPSAASQVLLYQVEVDVDRPLT